MMDNVKIGLHQYNNLTKWIRTIHNMPTESRAILAEELHADIKELRGTQSARESAYAVVLKAVREYTLNQ